jgi:hypothetical protein
VELIKRKLLAQESLVRKQFQDEPSAETIADQRHALAKANSKEEIRRYEAYGALAYWRAWHGLPIRFSQSDLKRIPEHWQIFGSRVSPLTKSPRLAVNPPNAMLNYLYAILESEARLAISELGLDPGIGMLHNDMRTRDSLALDLLEPIRPQVDAFLLEWLRREPLQRKWFFEERDGNCRLTGEFAAQLSETSKLWKQALGPFAEWMLRTLWSGCSSTSKIESPATRLTQDRRREGKGIPTPSLENAPVAARNYIPIQSRESVLGVARPARLNRFDPVAQARRADSQRRQAAALKAWNPSDNPDWLDEKTYLKKIKPRLAGIAVSTIVTALSVTEPYATNIRSGHRVPHRRHWKCLAQLTGVTDMHFTQKGGKL